MTGLLIAAVGVVLAFTMDRMPNRAVCAIGVLTAIFTFSVLVLGWKP